MSIILMFTALALAVAPLHAQEFSTATMRAITLDEAFTLALVKSEQLAMQGEYIKQLDAAERALHSYFRPSLALNASRSRQENAAAVTKGYVSGNYSVFSGLRDYISAKAAAATTRAAQLNLARSRQELYLGVAQSYLDLVAAQREILIRREQIDVTARRIKELESRAAIGRSRASEVAAAKAQLAQDKAAYLNAAATERLAQQSLMFVTGLSAEMVPADITVKKDADAEMYLKLVLARPDIAARRKALEAYGHLAYAQEHNLWPAVNLTANYYALRNPMPAPPNRWDAALALTMPLYTGGHARSQRDAAYAARRGAELALTLAERQAQSEVRAAYEEFRYSILQADSLAEALTLASDNARYQQQDYKMGLVTNLEVLSALNSVLQTRLGLSQARVNENWTFLKLQAAAGVENK